MIIWATSGAGKRKKKGEKKHPIRIQKECAKSDPANRIRPESGCPLAVMAKNGRIRHVHGVALMEPDADGLVSEVNVANCPQLTPQYICGGCSVPKV